MEPTLQPQENKSSIGSIIGTVIIIAIIILGGLYFWGKRVEETRAKQNLVGDSVPQQTIEQNEASSIQQTTSSDDVNSIEADLNATNLEGLDAELDAQLQ